MMKLSNGKTTQDVKWIDKENRTNFIYCAFLLVLFGLISCFTWFHYTIKYPKSMIDSSFHIWGVMYFISAVIFLLINNPILSLISMFGLLATWCLWCIARYYTCHVILIMCILCYYYLFFSANV